MELLFSLSKEDLDLAKSEISSLLGSRVERYDDLAVTSSASKLYKRLAYTRKVYNLLFTVKKKEFIESFSSYPWKKVYKKSFCVRSHLTSFSDKDLAKIIWHKLNNPNVDLKNPKTGIEIFEKKGKIFCGLLLWENKEVFSERKAHKRPFLHPTAMDPKLARALINLTSIKKGVILDPFCGSGGILIEAGIMGLKPEGIDLDKVMINRTEKNLSYFKIKDYFLKVGDATKLNKNIKYLVTDLPYGKNSKAVELQNLYSSFLIVLEKNLSGTAVVCFPDFCNPGNLIKKSNLKVTGKYSVYMHKSLTKLIYTLKRK